MSEVYIEKEAAIRNICKGCGLFDTDNCICTGSVRCDEYDAILDTPSANVKPVVMARWKRIDEYVYGEKWQCTHCEETNQWRARFCPNCGADMRGESPR